MKDDVNENTDRNPLAKEFITYALEHDGCVFGEPEHFLKVMKHNTGFVGGLTKYGQDRAGLERPQPADCRPRRQCHRRSF